MYHIHTYVPGTSERFVANCGVGPSTRGQGDSAYLVKPTQDQRREHKAVVSLVGPASKVKADCWCAKTLRNGICYCCKSFPVLLHDVMVGE